MLIFCSSRSQDSKGLLVANVCENFATMPRGVIPERIQKLVDARARVKTLLKTEADEEKRAILEIRQLALKLAANCLYGCLGRRDFRFAACHIAALVTRLGRENLRASVQLIEQKFGVPVAYGDTDSMMVNTKTTDVRTARTLLQAMILAINENKKSLVSSFNIFFALTKKRKSTSRFSIWSRCLFQRSGMLPSRSTRKTTLATR